MWLDIVVVYNGNAISLLQYLITRYHNNGISVDDGKLKAVNEFAVYSIDKQYAHLQNTLLEFYNGIFSNIIRKHDHSTPLIYPVDLYEIVCRFCYY